MPPWSACRPSSPATTGPERTGAPVDPHGRARCPRRSRSEASPTSLEALRAVRSSRAGRVMEPVLVQWLGRAPIGAPGAAGRERARPAVGTSSSWRTVPSAADRCHGPGGPRQPGTRWTGAPSTATSSRWTAAGWPLLPATTGSPSHAPGPVATALVIVAPTCPLPTPAWGTFLPLHALSDRTRSGRGDLRRPRSPGPVDRPGWGCPGRHAAAVSGVPGRAGATRARTGPSPNWGGTSSTSTRPGCPSWRSHPWPAACWPAMPSASEVEASRASRFVDHGPVMAALRSVLGSHGRGAVYHIL